GAGYPTRLADGPERHSLHHPGAADAPCHLLSAAAPSRRPRAQELFAQAFGEIVKHPTMGGKTGSAILELHSHEGVRANSWHTDVTFGLRPPKLSVLRALALPDAAGDTVWANTVAAYQHLPSSLQDLVDKLWAVHGNDFV
ncbi:TauD/TfdA dioxygenase family protein, partial [Burkholderia pseudomallei]|uniref:TauD/TfdA dioxygenase family protein n=1 Tax=Burkholderia pseudomallei TaxID=28450 RepID=UPI00406C3245